MSSRFIHTVPHVKIIFLIKGYLTRYYTHMSLLFLHSLVYTWNASSWELLWLPGLCVQTAFQASGLISFEYIAGIISVFHYSCSAWLPRAMRSHSDQQYPCSSCLHPQGDVPVSLGRCQAFVRFVVVGIDSIEKSLFSICWPFTNFQLCF